MEINRRSQRSYEFLMISLFIIYEQAMISYQIHDFRPLLAAAYYAVDVPFFFLVTYHAIPYGFRRPYSLLRIPLTAIFVFLSYILAQNIVDSIVFGLTYHKFSIGDIHFSYKKSLWRGTYLSILAVAYYLSREGIKKAVHMRDLEIKNLELEAAYYRSKIKPHLIFNTLNFIHGLVEETSEKASRTISLFAKVMRYYLVNSTASVPVIKELEQVNDYIELNRARLGDQLCLDIEINTDPAIDKLEIPPQFLVNFVENMFMHGNLLDKEQPAQLFISNEGRVLQMRSWNLKTTARKLNTTGVGMRYVKNQLSRQSTTSYKLSINETEQFYELLFSIEL